MIHISFRTMITYPFSKISTLSIRSHTSLFMWHMVATLFLITSAHANDVIKTCDTFSQPFDDCFERAGQLLVKGQLNDAQSIYQLAASNVLTLPPHLQVATQLNLARIDRWQGRHAQAKIRYRDFLQTNPNNTEALIGLSLIAMEEKQFDDSHRFLLQAKQLGDSSQELVLATQWLQSAWKYQLTVGAQAMQAPSGNSRLPIFTLEYALNQAVTARVGARALDINLGNANSLSDFSGKSRVLELGAMYKPNQQHSINVQLDQVYNGQGDHALKLAYELKKTTFNAFTFYQNALQNGLHNQEFRGDVTVPIFPMWTIKSALNVVRENTQYSHQHAQIGMRYDLTKYTYLQTVARQSSTRYQQSLSSSHSGIELEVGVKPSAFNSMRLTLLADQLANKRQANAAWTFEGQPRFELRHEWVQYSTANLTTQQNNSVADLKVSVTPALDFKLSLSHQSLSKTTSALGLLVYRWQ
jgi:tetratricopeptide (TPR) repeat protein